MTIVNARRLFIAFLGFCLVVLAAPLAQTAPAQPRKPNVKAPQTEDSVEKKEPAIGERILAQLLAKLERPRVQLDLNYGNDGQVNTLRTRLEAPLKGEVAIPLQAPTGKAEIDKLIPTAALKTTGLIVRWTANMDEQGRTLSNDVTFHDRAGNRVPLVLTLRSELTDLLDLRIESLKVHAAGLDKASTAIEVGASCDLKQSLVDLQTGRIGWEDTACEFKGKFVKNVKEEAGVKKFTYRFKFDSF